MTETEKFVQLGDTRAELDRFCRFLEKQGVDFSSTQLSPYRLVLDYLQLDPDALEAEDAGLPVVEFEER